MTTTNDSTGYVPGDVVNGHVLTQEHTWVPVSGDAPAQVPPAALPPVETPAGTPAKQGWSTRRKVAVALAAAAVALVGISAVSGGGDTTSTPAAGDSQGSGSQGSDVAPVPTPDESGVRFDGDGMYAVGSEIQPGLYRSEGGGYWERLSGASGEFDDIIANGNGDGGAVYVEIEASDKYFSTSRFADWVLVEATTGPQATSFSGDGMYRVGVDIAPGTYRATGDGYWERLSGASGEFGDIVANGNGDGSVIVTIAPGDAFFATSGFSDWTQVS